MEMGNTNVLKKLLVVQQYIKAPKGQKNTFGNFFYRSCEDILEQARPLCNDNGAVLLLDDKVEQIDDRFYVVATATIYDVESGESISVSARAREAVSKKGMDDSQITGASSSYARKYALGGLLSLDNNKDADAMDNTNNGFSPSDKNKIISSICKKIADNKLTNDIVVKILQKKYDKHSSNQLSIKELLDLDKNIYLYSTEFK